MDTLDLRSLEMVLQRETELRDIAARALREAEQRVAQVLAQSEALQTYRRETARRWSTPAGELTSTLQLQTTRGFLARLDEALDQQRQAEHRADSLATQRRTELMAAEQRVAVVEKLIARRTQTHVTRVQRREQKSTDELAQQLLAHATTQTRDLEPWPGA
jgi:flagellar protein FliJ